MNKRQILFATGNIAKSKRFSKGLERYNIEVLSLKDLNLDLDVEEDGKNPIDNALIKARAAFNKMHMPTIGMDDTLYIENIPKEKQPGLYVRRVNGKTLTDEEMIEYYTSLVKEYGINERLNCKYVYGLAVINENGEENSYTWEKSGFYMVDTPSKIINPGYPLNSITKYAKTDKYFSETTDEELKQMQVNEDDVVEFIAIYTTQVN